STRRWRDRRALQRRRSETRGNSTRASRASIYDERRGCGSKDDEGARGPLRCAWIADDQPLTVSPTTLTVRLAVTSVCITIDTGCSPTCLSGPDGMRTIDFS